MAQSISPGMQQYLAIKEAHPDAFLLFRMGDFYELFYEDAVKAAQILELTLTSRNKNSENPIPMAGMPYHSASQYIDKLVDLGYKVAIAEQMEDPKTAVGVVKREVVQVLTPGTRIDGGQNAATNNYLSAAIETSEGIGFAYIDLATGEFKSTCLKDFDAVLGQIASLASPEVVLSDSVKPAWQQALSDRQILTSLQKEQALDNSNLALSLSSNFAETSAARRLLAYVFETQKRSLTHLQELVHYDVDDYLKMDYSTKQSLDLLRHAKTGKKYGTLYWLLDETKTAMGTRKLAQWLDRPLIQQTAIEKRQALVSCLKDHYFERADLTEHLKGVYDIERLASRVSFGKATPKDLLQLARTLSKVPAIRGALQDIGEHALMPLIEGLDDLGDLRQLIADSIDEDAPVIITEGQIIKAGFHEQLDTYRDAMQNGASWIAELEQAERQKAGINLKIDYNKKDGYFFHITNSQLDKVPAHFYRKATLKNSERYGSEELAKIERTILDAKEESTKLEYQLFLTIRERVLDYIKPLQKLAETVAQTDVFQALAQVAEQGRYVLPEFNSNGVLAITEGRHPVVEKVMGQQSYVPNSIDLPAQTSIELITGPNMAGKSTYMRQLALTVIMGQIGSFVPADAANLPIFDALFTRIGASDDLTSGQSTFMVEMMEANQAIQAATPNSLILFDELGRGTATYDGMALAQAIIEYIHDKVHAKTLFSTHYHELTELASTLHGLANVHVATLEEDGEVVFLHRMAKGPADQSYGIHVAKLAGLPDELISRARQVLQTLEDKPNGSQDQQLSLFDTVSQPVAQSPSHPVLQELAELDVMQMTPLEAMMKLAQLKALI